MTSGLHHQAGPVGPVRAITGIMRRSRASIHHLVGANLAAQRTHSGSPAFRRPAINSFEFDSAPSDISSYCKGGIELKHMRRRLLRLRVATGVGETACEAAIT